MKYRIIDDLTSDVMFEAYGKDAKELFENAATALFSVICDIGSVADEQAREFAVEGKDERELMMNWLAALIASVDIDEMFYSQFTVEKITPTSLRAVCAGESITPGKGGTVVKAVTNHQFAMGTEGGRRFVRATLDI
ncbi:archease [Candidatus Woesearchaeota archaeon]|nr:archease [Candidatus Woesearchaeota archaeon]